MMIDVDSLSVAEIKSLMRVGDQKLIADITEYTLDYVEKVLDGLRNNTLIVEVARLILKDRQDVVERSGELKKEYQLKRFQQD